MTVSPDQLRALTSAVGDDLHMFLPELLVAAGVLVVLLARLVPALDRAHLSLLAALPCLAALGFVGVELAGHGEQPFAAPAFGGLIVFDPFAAVLRGLLLLFAVLALLLGRLTGIPDAEDSGDYIVMLLGGTLGMMLMVAANHLLMVFIAMEMASLPCYALAGFLKGRRHGSEAAMKYVVYGAAASGVTLYGLSLLLVTFGTGDLAGIGEGLGRGVDPMAAAGLLFFAAGLAFKLSAVPFHFWCPDVFEGAAAEVGAFLSVASKAAAIGLTVRVLTAFTATDPALRHTVGLIVLGVAALTMTVGNFAALRQSNLKRMFAYSTIAHAGYMLTAVAILAPASREAVLYYLLAYLPTSLGAFAVAAAVRNRTGSETLDGIRGLVATAPALTVALAVFLLSLLGLPPLAGFAGKFQLFDAVYHAADRFGWVAYAAVAVGVLNTVVSAGYYLAVLRAAVLDDPSADALRPTGAGLVTLVLVLAAAVVVLGLVWDPVARLTALAGGP